MKVSVTFRNDKRVTLKQDFIEFYEVDLNAVIKKNSPTDKLHLQ